MASIERSCRLDEWQVNFKAVCHVLTIGASGKAIRTECAQKEKNIKGKAEESKNFVKGNVAQILGIRGGDKESNIWKIRLQLTKPVTWIPLIWGELSARMHHFCTEPSCKLTVVDACSHPVK